MNNIQSIHKLVYQKMYFRAKRMQQVVQHTTDWTHQNKYQILYNNEIINGKIIKSLWQEIGSTRLCHNITIVLSA
jgi:hypothetical protein